MTQQPQVTVKKKRPVWPWIVGGILAIGACNSLTGGPKEETAAQPTQPAEPKKVLAIDEADFSVKCEESVRRQLKLPDSAKFSSFLENRAKIDENTGTYTGWVEAENSFGGKVRNNFTCTYDKATNTLQASLEQ